MYKYANEISIKHNQEIKSKIKRETTVKCKYK